MDDQDWLELDAASEAGSTPDLQEAPSDSTEPLGLQSETQSSETIESPEQPIEATAAEAETETVPDAVAQRIAELERELAAKVQAEAQRKAEWDERLRQFQERETQRLVEEDQQEAQAFLEELRQTDPEWAQKFEERRNFLAWSADQAKREAFGSYNALESLTMVLDNEYPELMKEIIPKAAALSEHYPTTQQKLHAIGAWQQAKQSESAKVTQLESQIRELRNQLEAKSRPLAADVVEGGPTGRGSSFEQLWKDATDFDQAFRLIS